jgi:polyisoprenyl-teichoic acid--peptidoglycan teichoic acid transferase
MAAWNITQISVTGVGSYSSTTYSMPEWSLYIMVPDEESVENAREQIRDNYN